MVKPYAWYNLTKIFYLFNFKTCKKFKQEIRGCKSQDENCLQSFLKVNLKSSVKRELLTPIEI